MAGVTSFIQESIKKNPGIIPEKTSAQVKAETLRKMAEGKDEEATLSTEKKATKKK